MDAKCDGEKYKKKETYTNALHALTPVFAQGIFPIWRDLINWYANIAK